MASRIAQFLSAFSGALNDSTVTLKEGRKALAENDRIPRITHVPIGGGILPPDMVGEGLLAGNGMGTRDKIIAIRSFSFQMYCQAGNKEITEQLLHNAIAAWYSACSGSVSFDQEVWIDQQEGEDDVTRRGHQVSATVTLMVPVYATPKPLTQLRSTGQDMGLILGNMYGDGSSYGAGHTYHAPETFSFTQTF